LTLRASVVPQMDVSRKERLFFLVLPVIRWRDLVFVRFTLPLLVTEKRLLTDFLVLTFGIIAPVFFVLLI
jgi:hypothetical protein